MHIPMRNSTRNYNKILLKNVLGGIVLKYRLFLKPPLHLVYVLQQISDILGRITIKFMPVDPHAPVVLG